MRKLKALFLSDREALKNWFSSQLLSKLLVVAGFLVVFSVVFMVIFLYSRIFFRNLTFYKVFGYLTANYILHASLLVVFLFAVGSAIASTITMVTAPSAEIDYLLSLPVDTGIIALWLFLKSVLINLFLLVVVLFPIILSYKMAFLNHTSGFLARSLFALLLLVVATNGIGAILGFLLAPWFRRKKTLKTVLTILFFLIFLVAFSRIVLPQSLIVLYRASPAQFIEIYNSLPLSSPFIPTYWLTSLITAGPGVQTILFLILAFGIAIFSVEFQKKNLISIVQTLKSRVTPTLAGRRLKRAHFLSHKPARSLVYKDWLSIVRSPSETSYIFFLSSIVLLFFLFLSRINVVRSAGDQWAVELTIFTFIWLLFFVVAFLLRIVFPLVAREGKSSWYIFTLPIKKGEILSSKMDVASLLVLPLLLAVVFVFLLLPFIKGTTFLTLVIVSFWAIVFLSLTNVLLGAVFPNFEKGDDPEKVSTSTMGIVTLLVSALVIAVSSVLTRSILLTSAFPKGALVVALVIVFFLIFGVYKAASSSISKYQF